MQSLKTQSKIRIGSAWALGVPPKAVMAFYDAHWNRRIALAIPSYYHWQFCMAPASGGVDHCAVAVDDRDEILGVMGVTPRNFMLAGKERNAAELTTWIVSEAARGHGVGRGILQYLQHEYDVLLGAGISEAAVPIYRSSGFRLIRSLPRYVRVLRKPPSGFIRTTQHGDRLLQAQRPARVSVRAHEIAVAEAALIAKSALTQFNHYVRDVKDLEWRYDRHPAFRHRFFQVEDTAVVCLREDRVDEIGFVHVVECFGEDRALAAVTSFLDGFCLDNGAYFVDATCTAGAISRFLLAAGWFSVMDDKEVQVTSLFHPLEFREPPTTSLVLWARDGMSELMDSCRLYCVKGDLDLDRPTYAYYETHGLLGGA